MLPTRIERTAQSRCATNAKIDLEDNLYVLRGSRRHARTLRSRTAAPTQPSTSCMARMRSALDPRQFREPVPQLSPESLLARLERVHTIFAHLPLLLDLPDDVAQCGT